MNTLQAVGITVVVAIALGLALVVPTGQSVSMSGTTSISARASTGSTGPNGLQLVLSVNDTSISSGQSFGLTVSEYNTLAHSNNVSASTNWVIEGATASCPSQVYPFGISVFQGRYTAANVSMGTPVQIFPIAACPMFIRLITGYDFLPQSVNASVLPGSSNSTTAMEIAITVGLNYTGPSIGSPGQPLSPGAYTLAASDEWGNLVFLYVNVE